MTPKQKQRILILLSTFLAIFAAIGLLIYASRNELNYYYGPGEVKAGKAPLHKSIRIGGLVAPNSIKKYNDRIDVHFTIIDGEGKINVAYNKTLPDLFREGQGVIATGILDQDHNFMATEILAKHDENYMPPEVADTLKKSGHPSSIPLPSAPKKN